MTEAPRLLKKRGQDDGPLAKSSKLTDFERGGVMIFTMLRTLSGGSNRI